MLLDIYLPEPTIIDAIFVEWKLRAAQVFLSCSPSVVKGNGPWRSLKRVSENAAWITPLYNFDWSTGDCRQLRMNLAYPQDRYADDYLVSYSGRCVSADVLCSR